jgi:hypothetical protein
MAHVLEEIDREWDDSLADELFNKIISEIDKYFNT